MQKREWWESKIDNGYLRKGYGVIMSLDGHVVRLEAINELGMVVDDPYGASKLAGRTFEDGRAKYSFDDTNSRTSEDGSDEENVGEDTGYPWSDVEKYSFKYVIAFK